MTKEPDFQKILAAKRKYYGPTEAAIEFAAEEFVRQSVSWDLKQSRKNMFWSFVIVVLQAIIIALTIWK